MTDRFDVDPTRAVVLPSDFTTGIVEHYAFDGTAAVERAAAVCQAARQAAVPVIHVAPGRLDPKNPVAQFHPAITPVEGDTVVNKTRIGAFSTTGLDVQLRASGRDIVVLMGIATSGTVLSSARWAYDLGYKIVVVADACSDPDPEVHRILTEPVHDASWIGLWRLADVVTAESMIATLTRRT